MYIWLRHITRIFVLLILPIVLVSCSFENIDANNDLSKAAYIDDAAFEFLQNAYDRVDFNITFESGDKETYCFYIDQFHRLVNLEASFYAKRTGQYYYLSELGGLSVSYFDPADFMYLFFDMTGDGIPNLGIMYMSRYTYIFSCDRNMDRFTLWCEVGPGYAEILGTRKMRWGGGRNPLVYTYVVLDEYANHLVYVQVAKFAYPTEYGWSDTTYLVSVPMFLCYDKIQVPENILQQASTFNLGHDGALFFEVTEEQFLMLTYSFLNTRPTAHDINAVTFSYSELFGGISCHTTLSLELFQ